jgi:hypothetical protein
MMAKSTGEPIFSLVDLEREIAAEVKNVPSIRRRFPSSYAPPMAGAPSLAMPDDMAMPDYVKHREGGTEIGRLSAEAVVREYEAAAKAIEAMGGELIERVKQCEAMTRDALSATDEMKETARRYREEAKRIFRQIEDCSMTTAEVRKTCTKLKKRIAAPATALA